MRRLFYVLMALALITACSKKETAAPPAAATIIGKWTLVGDTTKLYTDGILAITSATADNGAYVQFNSNFTGVEYLPGGPNKYSDKFKYQINGGNTIVEYRVADTIQQEPFPADTLVQVIKSNTLSKLQLALTSVSLANGVTDSVVETSYYTK